jgi:hypothetical protein
LLISVISLVATGAVILLRVTANAKGVAERSPARLWCRYCAAAQVTLHVFAMNSVGVSVGIALQWWELLDRVGRTLRVRRRPCAVA